jgi:hypothetical protein
MFHYNRRDGGITGGMDAENTECQAFFPIVRVGSPPPQPQRSVAPPPFGSEGETHSLAGKGAGGPKSDEGTHSDSGTCILLSLYGRIREGECEGKVLC